MSFLEKVENLPNTVRDYFLSDNPRLDIEKSCLLYGINSENIKNISGHIGLIIIKELRLSDLPKIVSDDLSVSDPKSANGISYELNKRIFNQFPDFFTDSQRLLDEWAKQKSDPIISEEEAWQKVLELEPWLKEKNQSSDNEKIEVGKKEEPRKIVTKMSLSEILKVYPTAGEQLVTKNHVKLKIFPEPVRPSVKNWITDYTENLGYDRHTSIQRGEYLFKSENGKSLDSEDRGKLSQLLKSFDESEGLEIDTQKKQIVFEKNTEKQNKPEEKSSFSQESGVYCRYAPPAPSDTKFHKELPNQIHLKQDIPEKKPEVPKKTAAQDDGFTVNLRQPMRIRPVSGGDTSGADGINPDNVVNLKK